MFDTYRVTINGRALPARTSSMTTIDAGPYLIKGTNTIKVEVATTLNNRLRVVDIAFKNNTRQNYGLVGPARLVPYGEAAVYAQTETPGGVGGTVPATLSLQLGAPGDLRRVHARRRADLRGVHDGHGHLDRGRRDARPTDPGRLTNGAFSLEPLQVALASGLDRPGVERRRHDRLQAAHRRHRPAAHRAPTARRSRSRCRRRRRSLGARPRHPALTGPGPSSNLADVDFRWEDEQLVADLPHARAVFSTRLGGVSGGPYDSLNLGMLTEDAPENVTENRARLGAVVGQPWERFCYGRQVHGTTVRRATEPPSAERPYTQEDGQATALADAAAIVFVADCLPVLLAAEGAVAALHCGWRPLAGGIIEEGIAALREVGGTGPITAAIGPGARGCCYEVGEEVHAHFAAYDARNGRNLDLAAVAAKQLGDVEILDTGLCTICDERFFSHRRDHGITGRQSGVICRA